MGIEGPDHPRQGPMIDGVGSVKSIRQLAVDNVKDVDELEEGLFEIGCFIGLQRQAYEEKEYKQTRHALPNRHSRL